MRILGHSKVWEPTGCEEGEEINGGHSPFFRPCFCYLVAGTACFQVGKEVLRGTGLAEVSWHDSSEVAEQLERVYLEEAVMSYHLASASLRRVPLPAEKPSLGPSGPREGSRAPMQAHGVGAQMASQHRIERTSCPGLRATSHSPGCPGREGLLPEWDVSLLVPILGVTTLPPNKRGRGGHCSLRPFTFLCSWVLSSSVRPVIRPILQMRKLRLSGVVSCCPCG